MTEAVKAMCHWALRQQGVSGVLAETELDGTASQKILERCGFAKYRHDATIWWETATIIYFMIIILNT